MLSMSPLLGVPPPPLLALLRAAALDRADLMLADFGGRQIRWAAESGLGALLLRMCRPDRDLRHSPHWPMLHGADLTARVLCEAQLEAMSEIIDALRGHVSTPTLLKGISVCEQYYPMPHLRPMRDIDFLLPREEVPIAQSVLARLGYLEDPNTRREWFTGFASHHAHPLVHPRTGIWVEVHHGLFPPQSAVRADPIFDLQHVRSQTYTSVFHGRPVARLSDEFQLAYLASHWALSFKLIGDVGGVVPMLDVIYLLKSNPSVRWDLILSWLDGTSAAAHLYLMLSYLHKRAVVDLPFGVLGALRKIQKPLGTANLEVAHTILDRYVVGRRTFGRLVTRHSLEIVWETLLSAGSPRQNLSLIGWRLFSPWRFVSRARKSWRDWRLPKPVLDREFARLWERG
jgi:hypothetical protein